MVHLRVAATGGGWETVTYEVDETLPLIGFKVRGGSLGTHARGGLLLDHYHIPFATDRTQALLVDCHEAFSEIAELRLLFKGRALGDDGTLGEVRSSGLTRGAFGRPPWGSGSGSP